MEENPEGEINHPQTSGGVCILVIKFRHNLSKLSLLFFVFSCKGGGCYKAPICNLLWNPLPTKTEIETNGSGLTVRCCITITMAARAVHVNTHSDNYQN